MRSNNILWSDKSCPNGLPLSLTTYILTDEKLLIRKGLLNQQEEEVRLYRILSISLNRTLSQRLCGIGTIHCCAADKTNPEFDIVDVKDPRRVMEILSDAVEQSRERKGVTVHELMSKKYADVDPDNLPDGLDLHAFGDQKA